MAGNIDDPRKSWLTLKQPNGELDNGDDESLIMGLIQRQSVMMAKVILMKSFYEDRSLVPAATYNRNQVDQWLDMFHANCLINGQQMEPEIDNGSSTNLVA